jgi:predicted glycosyltransferase
MSQKPRVLVHCQFVYGIGHFVRTIELCKSLISSFRITLVSGGEAVPNFQIPQEIEFIQLPAIYKDDGNEELKVVDPESDLKSTLEYRKLVLTGLVEKCNPDIFISEHFPFGLLFEDEVLTIIGKIKSYNPNCKLVCSVRDIILTQEGTKSDLRSYEILNDYYDLVLIHGDPNFMQLRNTFPYELEIKTRIEYTGYVVERLSDTSKAIAKSKVVVSVAAGRIGSELITFVLKAVPEITNLIDIDLIIFTGAFQKDIVTKSQQNDYIKILPFHRTEYIRHLQDCNLLICLAGYNTIIEATSISKAILVYQKEFSEGNDEQQIRLRMFESLGLLQAITFEEISKGALSKKILESLKNRTIVQSRIDTNGADRTAYLLEDLLSYSQN